jgi:cardiolipin synthase A/B
MSWILTYNIIEWAIRLGMILVILRRRLMPAASLAWMSVIFFLPVFGIFAYMLVGDARLGRIRRKLHRNIVITSRKKKTDPLLAKHVIKPEIDPTLAPFILQAENIGGMSILGGNDAEFLGETDEFIQRVIDEIDQAKHFIHMLFYIFAPDETGEKIGKALKRAAGRGVTCRLLLDGAGSRSLLHRSGLLDELRHAGVDVQEALPVQLVRRGLHRIDLRNHRKMVIIDGLIAFTGSQNIVNPDYGKGRGEKRLAWVDLSGRFTGPIVHHLHTVFLEDWAFETGDDLAVASDNPYPILPPIQVTGTTPAQIIPSGPSEHDAILPNALLIAIGEAKKRITITSPYFVPDEPTLMALIMASSRGVEVELILPHRGDHPIVTAAGRFYYRPLLEAGVNIHHFVGGLLHAKTVTVDDSFALLGSTNMDMRSFYLNFELNVVLYGPQITARLRFAQTSYLNNCEQIVLEDWIQTPRIKQYWYGAAALFSPLL